MAITGSLNRQTTDSILMVRPAAFAFNVQTAGSNSFQHSDLADNSHAIHASALKEFDDAVQALRNADVSVTVVEDTAEPAKPDAIFPNNWFSTHSNGAIVLYPMFTPNRRLERRIDLVEMLTQRFGFGPLIDLSFWEDRGKVLEGTGSMVLDRVHRIAYACLSPRTDSEPFAEFCMKLNYRPVTFVALDRRAEPIYHTNVVMAIGEKVAVICLECIADPEQRESVADSLRQMGKSLLDLSYVQLQNFAGNMLEIRNTHGRPVWALSACAWQSLTEQQQSLLSADALVVAPAIPTIERVGGGSLRCMIAELFLPSTA